MSPHDKPLAWLHGHVETPPFSREARLETGFLLRRLQQGEKLGLPYSRPMPSVGVDAIVILEVFPKKTGKTPKKIIDICKQRLRHYDSD